MGTGMEARRAMRRPLQRQMRHHGGLGQNANSVGFKKSSESRLFGMSDFLTDDMWGRGSNEIDSKWLEGWSCRV